MRSRLAPTPSGRLHIGNIYNFILTWWYVRSNDGTLILRIDDSDRERTRDDYVVDIFETLHWLGMSYDEGPSDLEDFKKNYSQQNKIKQYWEQLSTSTYLFNCDCSRKDYGHLSCYPGTCKDLCKVYRPSMHSIRIKDGDTYPILWRKDNSPAYHLCSLKDDIDMGITHIIRGDDLIDSSILQKHIAPLINLNFPAHIFHHSLLTKKGEKLSKTQRDLGVREEFKNPEEVFSYLAPYLKTAPFKNLNELSKRAFSSSTLLPL